ncbi:MAG TPA: NADH-quinone oxidoreductase subunit K [Deferrimonas sp.]|jgi:multicomponent Na+:H+ antiporter subunit C
MELLIAIVVGGLYAAGIYMLLRPSPVKLAIGLGLLTNAVNLLIFVAAGLTPGRAPLVEAGAVAPSIPFADPLPQALILTAIVIAFGVLAFTLVLLRRAAETLGVDNLDEMRSTD